MHWVKVCGVLGPRVWGFRVEGLGGLKWERPRVSRPLLYGSDFGSLGPKP